MNDFIGLIGNVGFPIIVAFYLLARIEPKMDSLTAAIAELTASMKQV